MDEELEQRGLTPKFFDQRLKLVRQEASQKTSNSNLSLLNELKEKLK